MALVDIIIPTCNRASVLPETLKSVQAQTFSDWRCFIAEDGETPETLSAVAPFLEDGRFTYLSGAHAGCPAAPRNRAIRQGAAPFIAFLDDDDLWLPEKLAAQMHFMEQHPACVLLAANAYRWSGTGSADMSTPFFPQNPPAGKIPFETLVACNIIINSTAVIRRPVLSRSGPLNEAPRLALCEDYELWLRMAALGEVWVMEQALAVYRDTPQASIREGLTPYVYYKKLALVFSAALRGSPEVRSPLAYPENKQLAALCRQELARLRQQERRRRLVLARRAFGKHATLSILAFGRLLGRLASFFMKSPDRSRPSIFMIFPYYHTGGAERVHADIITCLRDYRPWVIVVRASNNRAFKKEFARGGRLIDLSLLCERIRSRVVFLMLAECLAEIINSADNAVVFGCNAPLFYDILPLLSENVKKIDLTHAFGGLEYYSLPCVPLLDVRVGINQKALDNLACLYQENGVDAAYLRKMRIIENRTHVPLAYHLKAQDSPTVIYVGRGTVEKRVHLVGKIAKKCLSDNPAMRFILVGDVCESVLPQDRQFCTFAGEVFEQAALEALYKQSHLLILTSEREGMPLVIMEAMAHGVVPIATDVGGIGAHVENGINGFLVRPQDEEDLVTAFVEKIQGILENREAYERLSRSAHQYAVNNFTNDAFCSAYTELLTSPKKF
jgi:L-malate glycosyltransferase